MEFCLHPNSCNILEVTIERDKPSSLFHINFENIVDLPIVLTYQVDPLYFESVLTRSDVIYLFPKTTISIFSASNSTIFESVSVMTVGNVVDVYDLTGSINQTLSDF